MPLQKQNMQFPLNIGMSDRDSPQAASPEQAILMQNYTFEVGGTASIRYGLQEQPIATSKISGARIDNPTFIADVNGQPIIGQAGRISAYTKTGASTASLMNLGAYMPASIERVDFLATASQDASTIGPSRYEVVDVATANLTTSDPTYCVGTIEGDAHILMIFDQGSGALLARYEDFGPTGDPMFTKVISEGSTYIALLASVSGRFELHTFSAKGTDTSMTLLISVTSDVYNGASSVSDGSHYVDILNTLEGGSDVIAVAYLNAAGTDINVELRSSVDGTVSTSTTVASSTTDGLAGLTLSVSDDANTDGQLYMAWTERATGLTRTRHHWAGDLGTLSTDFGPSSLGSAHTTAGNMFNPAACYSVIEDRWFTWFPEDLISRFYSTTTSGTATDNGELRAFPITKAQVADRDNLEGKEMPFCIFNGSYGSQQTGAVHPRSYVGIVTDELRGESSGYKTHFVAELARDESEYTIVDSFSVIPPNRRQMSQIEHTADRRDLLAGIVLTGSTAGGSHYYPAAYRFDFDSAAVGQYVKIGGSTFINAAVPIQVDRASAVESGFFDTPSGLSLASSSTGGSLTDGIYQVRLVLVQVDANGDTHFSQVGAIQEETLSGGTSTQKITATIVPLYPTLRNRGDIRTSIAIYRTAVNGTVFYLDTMTSDNSTTVDVDLTQSDADLVDNQLLYTTGGILSNYPPPLCRHLAASSDRLFALGAEHQARIYYTKKKTFGSGLSWALPFSIDLAGQYGKATAIAYQDGRVIVFFARGIMYVQGDGPNDLGQGVYSPPQSISADVGCTEPRSVLTTDIGTFFKGERGIYLLDRGLNTVYVGNGVESYNSQEIRAACSEESAHQVKFLLDDEDTILVFNTLQQKWSVFVGFPWVSMANFDGETWGLGLISSSCRVYRESPYYVDEKVSSNSQIVTVIKTPWYKVAGVEGFKRIYKVGLAGELPSDATATSSTTTIDVYYDYDDSSSAQTLSFDWSVIGSSTNLLLNFKPGRQKCASIRFDISDGGPTSTPSTLSTPSWSTLTMTIGAKQGITKLPETKES